MVRHSRETEVAEAASNVTPLNLPGKRDA
jgi:hypothetical protein